MSEIESATNNSSKAGKKGFFVKLTNGNFGLAKTFWVYGVLVNIIFYVVFNIIVTAFFASKINTDVLTLIVFFLNIFMIFYNFVLFISILRASKKYKGPSTWAGLARIGAILFIISSLVLLSSTLRLINFFYR